MIPMVPLALLQVGDYVLDCEEKVHRCSTQDLPGATAYGRLASPEGGTPLVVPPWGVHAASLPDDARAELDASDDPTSCLLGRYRVVREQQGARLEDVWQDCGEYLVNMHPQGSEGWLAARRGLLTASNVGGAVGHCRFKTPEQVRAGETTVDDAARARMAHGTRWEPVVRRWYEKKHGVTVDEVGLAVPKWDPRIGGSLDGQVRGASKCIEIKCPQKMYWRVAQYVALTPESKAELGRYYHAHIFDSHYDQMQTCMAITGNAVCDYVVAAMDGPRADICVVSVPFNKEYWDTELYPLICAFLS